MVCQGVLTDVSMMYYMQYVPFVTYEIKIIKICKIAHLGMCTHALNTI